MNNSLNDLERSTFRSFWNDGLLDLMVGLAVLVMGLSWWQDVAAVGAVFPAVCVSLWHPLRRWLVEPRMGYVEFSGDREIKTRSFRHGMVAFFTGTMVLGVVVFFLWNGEAFPAPREWIAGFPLGLIGIPAVFFALFTGCRRFLLYAAVLMVSAVALVLQGWDPHVGMISSGALITAGGGVILGRFLARHSKEPVESP